MTIADSFEFKKCLWGKSPPARRLDICPCSPLYLNLFMTSASKPNVFELPIIFCFESKNKIGNQEWHWFDSYLTKFLDFGSTASDDASNLALMNQKTGIRIADTTSSFASNLRNLELKNQYCPG